MGLLALYDLLVALLMLSGSCNAGKLTLVLRALLTQWWPMSGAKDQQPDLFCVHCAAMRE